MLLQVPPEEEAVIFVPLIGHSPAGGPVGTGAVEGGQAHLVGLARLEIAVPDVDEPAEVRVPARIVRGLSLEHDVAWGGAGAV